MASVVQNTTDLTGYTAVATASELPGDEIFVNVGGTSWARIAVFTLTIDGANGTVAVPNPVGPTTVGPTVFALPSAWAANGSLDIRWVDDDAVQTSPDQILGLNNVTLAVPEPSTRATLALGLGALAAVVLRRRPARRA